MPRSRMELRIPPACSPVCGQGILDEAIQSEIPLSLDPGRFSHVSMEITVGQERGHALHEHVIVAATYDEAGLAVLY
jgi:hypothetical protein